MAESVTNETTHFKDFCIKFIKIANCQTASIHDAKSFKTVLNEAITTTFYDKGINDKVKFIFDSLLRGAATYVNEKVISDKHLTIGREEEKLTDAFTFKQHAIEVDITDRLTVTSKGQLSGKQSVPDWLNSAYIDIFKTTDDGDKKTLVDFHSRPIAIVDNVTTKIFSLFKYQNPIDANAKYVWKDNINMLLLFKPQILLLTFDIYCYNAGKKLFDTNFNLLPEPNTVGVPISVTNLDIKLIRPSFFMLLIYYAGYNFDINPNDIAATFNKKFKDNSFDIISYIENEKERLYIEKYSTNIESHKVNVAVETLELFYVGSIDSLWDYVNGKLTILIYNMLHHEDRDKAQHYANLFKKRYASNKLFLLECIKELKQYKQYISNSDITNLLFPVSTLKAIEILLVKLPYILQQIEPHYIPVESVSFDVTINSKTNTYTINSEYETTKYDKLSSVIGCGDSGSDNRIIERIFKLWEEELTRAYTQVGPAQSSDGHASGRSEYSEYDEYSDDYPLALGNNTDSSLGPRPDSGPGIGSGSGSVSGQPTASPRRSTAINGHPRPPTAINGHQRSDAFNLAHALDSNRYGRDGLSFARGVDELAPARVAEMNTGSPIDLTDDDVTNLDALNSDVALSVGQIKNNVTTVTDSMNTASESVAAATAAAAAAAAVSGSGSVSGSGEGEGEAEAEADEEAIEEAEADNSNGDILREAQAIEGVISEVGRAATEVTGAVGSVVSNTETALQELIAADTAVQTRERDVAAAENMSAAEKILDSPRPANILDPTPRTLRRQRSHQGDDGSNRSSPAWRQEAREQRAARVAAARARAAVARARAVGARAVAAPDAAPDATPAAGGVAVGSKDTPSPHRQEIIDKINKLETMGDELSKKITELASPTLIAQLRTGNLDSQNSEFLRNYNTIITRLDSNPNGEYGAIQQFNVKTTLLKTIVTGGNNTLDRQKNTFGDIKRLKKLIDTKFKEIVVIRNKFSDPTINNKLEPLIAAVQILLDKIDTKIDELESIINSPLAGGNIKYNNSTVKLSSRSDNTKTRKK